MMKFLLIVALMAPLACPADAPVRLFDFKNDARGWKGNQDVSDFAATTEGITFRTAERDPWIEGPAAGMPANARLKLRVRLKSSKAGSGQIYFGPQFTGEKVVGLPIRTANEWCEIEIVLPPQPERSRLRIDPPGNASCAVAWIDAQTLRPVTEFLMPPPRPIATWPEDAQAVSAGDLALSQHPTLWGAFRVSVGQQHFASGNGSDQIGVMIGGKAEWLDTGATRSSVRKLSDGSLESAVALRDSGGATWRCLRRFGRSADDGSIAAETEFSVDRERDVFHLPWVTLFPGLGAFGTNKTQALLPGVEYLENEPSSSEAEIEGEAADRRIVDDFRLCYPMMTLAAGGRYLTVSWDRRDHPGPVFDSPDRIFNSGAHLFGLWEPAVGRCRLEHDINVYDTFKMPANGVRRLKFRLCGGEGTTVAPAIQRYVRSHPLPPVPKLAGGEDAAVRLLSAGWTRSKIREGGLLRHAVWERFNAQPAADAPAFMRWLSLNCADAALKDALASAGQAAIEALPKSTVYAEGVSHVHPPLPPLLFGKLPEYLAHRLRAARQALGGFDANGVRHYRPAPDKPDYARTLGADHANGFAAMSLEGVLEAATLAGDAELSRQALAVLDRQTALYAGGVPRGAQPWEMPLHTPDILASARLARCYTLGFLLSGERKHLEQARYWAWTGLAMVYLDPPVDGEVGNYATIGVMGATNWRAPNWIGQPVQWCGLVYRSALLDLADADPEDAAFWRHVASGITLAGLQMTFPLTDPDRQGLLPDYFLLREQFPDGPAINPGTVGAGLPEAFGKGRLYAMARLSNGAIVHAPGAITAGPTEPGTVRFHVDGWPATTYSVLIAGLPKTATSTTWTGDQADFAVRQEPACRALILSVRGKGDVVLRF